MPCPPVRSRVLEAHQTHVPHLQALGLGLASIPSPTTASSQAQEGLPPASLHSTLPKGWLAGEDPAEALADFGGTEEGAWTLNHLPRLAHPAACAPRSDGKGATHVSLGQELAGQPPLHLRTAQASHSHCPHILPCWTGSLAQPRPSALFAAVCPGPGNVPQSRGSKHTH